MGDHEDDLGPGPARVGPRGARARLSQRGEGVHHGPDRHEYAGEEAMAPAREDGAGQLLLPHTAKG